MPLPRRWGREKVKSEAQTTIDLLRLLAEARERRINRVMEALLGAADTGVSLGGIAEVLTGPPPEGQTPDDSEGGAPVP